MKTSRRSFISQVAAAAAWSPFLLPSRARAAAAKPNSLLHMGFIGVGYQNNFLLDHFLWRDVKVVAVCDISAARREAAVAKVAQFHQAHPEKGAFACMACNDFRVLLEREDLDAVCIATPDHWHALITLAALKAGKDVYCEKPLTHNIHEAVEVMAAARKHKRILQTGSMQRSMSEFRVACELVRNGAIGKLERVTCKIGDPGRPCDLPGEDLEPGQDWDLWLGPAAVRLYNSVLSPRGVHHHYPNWRAFSEFGGGGVADFGAHHLDIAQWGLGMDESGPVEVRPPGQADALRGAVLVYENGVTVTQVGDGPDAHFFGTEGEVKVSRGSFEFIRGDIRITQVAKAEKEFLADAKIRLYRSSSHPDDFLARVADRQRPCTSAVEGGHSAICCHLMNLAYYHRQKIRWNPRKHAFAGGTGDRSWLTRDYRRPWKI